MTLYEIYKIGHAFFLGYFIGQIYVKEERKEWSMLIFVTLISFAWPLLLVIATAIWLYEQYAKRKVGVKNEIPN